MSQHKPRRENRLVSFLDLTQFTRAARGIPPEEVFGLLQEFYAHVAEAVRKSGGVVHKTIGDAVLSSWPEASVDAATQALLGLRPSVAGLMKKHGKPCQLDVKAHFGAVAAG